MNRKNLTSAVLAGLAGAAGIAATATAQVAPPSPTGMSLNPDGLGQVLIYPYYTTRNGNNTLLSVVNTTGDAKAVKVRFLEGENSREVLDFNLYLSPYDVWTAALLDGSVVDTNCEISVPGLEDGAGGGQCGVPHLLTTDTSCTVPYLFLNASTGPGLQAFLPFKFKADPENNIPGDGGTQEIARAAEGHFEMIEMGVLDPAGPYAPAVDHGNVGVPANCLLLTDAWTASSNPALNGVWINNPTAGFLPDDQWEPGGLFGGSAVINVAQGFMFSYDAKAINGFASSITPNATPLHAEPGSELPSLNSSDVTAATVFLDDGSTLTSTGLTRSVDAVSFLFMHDQIANEYSTEDSANGNTEWVLTFPTKAFYVDPDININLPAFPDAADPFVRQWGPPADGGDTSTACEPVVLGIVTDRSVDVNDPSFVNPNDPVLISGVFDREEQSTTPEAEDRPPIVSPAPPRPPREFEPFELCYETNIIRFGEQEVVGPTEIFGSLNYTNFNNDALGFEAGWVNIEMLTYETPGGFENRGFLGGLGGLPVVGFAAQKFGNQNAQAGIAAFYGGIYQHKGTRLESAAPAPTP